MDTLAAVALATEPPSNLPLSNIIMKKDDNIIQPIMWRNVISQSLYQITVMLIVMFIVPKYDLFGLDYDYYTEPFYNEV